MKVGDYVRTNNGEIGKLVNVEVYYVLGQNDKDKFSCVLFNNSYVPCMVSNDFIIKKGQLIDLIEVGDYVNGLPVRRICGTRWDENDLRVWLAVATKCEKEYGIENNKGNYEFETLYRDIKPENIKSVVTKEQFESMEYRIGE